MTDGLVSSFQPAAGSSARPDPDEFEGPRACDPHELGATLDLINLVLRTQPVLGPSRPPTFGWDFAHIYHQDNLHNVRIVCHRGRPVSSVGIYETSVRTPLGTIGVGGINGVVTHPDYRRRGLNTAALRDAQAGMRAAGLHMGLLSTTIDDYYKRLGWERAGRERRFVFDQPTVGYLPSADIDITEVWRPLVGDLCALHDNEPLAARRTPEQYALLAPRRVERIFVARRAETVVAYAATKGAVVREHGGAADDVAALLRRIFPLLAASAPSSDAAARSFEMTVVTPHVRTGLPELLDRVGVPSALEYLGMLLILDPPGLFSALGIDASIERAGDQWRLRDKRGESLLSDGPLVKLIFGPERRDDRPDVFPIEFFQWPMEQV